MEQSYYRLVREQVRADIAESRRTLDEMTSALDKIRKRLSDLEEIEKHCDHLLGESGDRSTDGINDDIEAESSKTITAPTLELVDIRPSTRPIVKHGDMAEKVLREASRKMSTQEIVDEMHKYGHRLPDDPKQQTNAVYSAMLRRQHIFKRVDRGHWILREWMMDPELAEIERQEGENLLAMERGMEVGPSSHEPTADTESDTNNGEKP